MRSTVKLLCVAVLVLLVSAPAWAQNGKCEPLKGAIGAEFDPHYVIPGADRPGAWVGAGYLAIGQGEPIVTTLVDKGLGSSPNNSGGLSGNEELTFTAKDGAVLMTVKFWGNARPVPYLNEYIASGDISGTGFYGGVTGNVHIRGQYIIDMGIFQGQDPKAWPWIWMAEINGTICKK